MSTNDSRRAAGKRALRPYAPATEGKQTALVDLLANLMHHLALDEHRGTVSFDDALITARGHYAEESREIEGFREFVATDMPSDLPEDKG